LEFKLSSSKRSEAEKVSHLLTGILLLFLSKIKHSTSMPIFLVLYPILFLSI